MSEQAVGGSQAFPVGGHEAGGNGSAAGVSERGIRQQGFDSAQVVLDGTQQVGEGGGSSGGIRAGTEAIRPIEAVSWGLVVTSDASQTPEACE